VLRVQGGLTWLWLDAPYVLTARKLFNWALEANDKGDVFPVSARADMQVT
jgi:gamma-glutamyl hydrolase